MHSQTGYTSAVQICIYVWYNVSWERHCVENKFEKENAKQYMICFVMCINNNTNNSACRSWVACGNKNEDVWV